MASSKHNWSALLDQRTHRMEMQYDPQIGHLHVPNVTARLPNGNGAYFSRTNSTGFRSDREFQNDRGDRPRILVFGDSFTGGQDSDNHERYSEQLGELLNAEVYNYGLSGSAPDQQLLIYERYAKEVEADLIIWGITIHNIERIKMKFRPSVDRMSGNTLLMPKPYFVLDDGELTLHHVPVPRTRPEIKSRNTRQFDDEQTEPSLIQRLSHMPVMRSAKNLLEAAGLKDRLRSLVYRATGVQIYDDYSDANSEGWQLLAALVKRFSELAGKTPVLVVPLPTYHYYVDRIKPVYDPLFASLDDPSAGLHIYAITRDLVKGKSLNDRKQICAETSGHYSAYGHIEIAKLLAKKIRELKLMPDQPVSVVATKVAGSEAKPANRYILGIAYHQNDSAAVLLDEGTTIAVGREEHFTQQLEQGGFPNLAANYCLEQAGLHQNDLTAVAVETAHREDVAEKLAFRGKIVHAPASTEDVSQPALSLALRSACKAWGKINGSEQNTSERVSAELGPSFSDSEIFAFLDMYELPHQKVEPGNRATQIAELLIGGHTVANFAGRMEYRTGINTGRAILADPSQSKTTGNLGNLEVCELKTEMLGGDQGLLGPVLEELHKKTGNNSLLHSPLQLAGEPVALTPFDAYRVIMFREVDAAMLGNFLIFKESQPDFSLSETTSAPTNG